MCARARGKGQDPQQYRVALCFSDIDVDLIIRTSMPGCVFVHTCPRPQWTSMTQKAPKKPHQFGILRPRANILEEIADAIGSFGYQRKALADHRLLPLHGLGWQARGGGAQEGSSKALKRGKEEGGWQPAPHMGVKFMRCESGVDGQQCQPNRTANDAILYFGSEGWGCVI